jgi:hypothetical protein
MAILAMLGHGQDARGTLRVGRTLFGPTNARFLFIIRNS